MSKKKQIEKSEMAAFMERLKVRPGLYEQFSRILDFNLLESFLKPEIRKAGRVAVSEFAMQTEVTCAVEAKNVQMQQREKKLRFYTLYGVDQIVTETDGSMVPFVYFEGKSSDRRKNRKVEYREVRLCASQAGGSSHTNYRAGIGAPEEIGQIWKQCTKESGRGADSFVNVVGDGAT